MARYDQIWDAIKKNGYAEITVHKSIQGAVEYGVKSTKSTENVARKLAGLVGWSKLVITRTTLTDHLIKIRFELYYLTAL